MAQGGDSLHPDMDIYLYLEIWLAHGCDGQHSRRKHILMYDLLLVVLMVLVVTEHHEGKIRCESGLVLFAENRLTCAWCSR